MRTDLDALLHLQEKDRALTVLSAELDGLKPQEDELDEQLAAAEAEVSAAEQELDSATNLRKELEGKIEGYRLLQERKRQKLEFVRGAKEASALMAELDLARSVMAQEEAEWIKSADRFESAGLRLENAKSAREVVIQEQAPAREELAARRSEIEERISTAAAEREKAEKEVKPPLLVRYERVLQGNAPLAMYDLHGEACGHCYTHVPKHIQQQLKNQNAIENCQGCGVMLYSSSQ